MNKTDKLSVFIWTLVGIILICGIVTALIVIYSPPKQKKHVCNPCKCIQVVEETEVPNEDRFDEEKEPWVRKTR